MERKNQESDSNSDGTNAGLMFLKELKKQFGESSSIENDFNNLVLQYNKGQISISELKTRVSLLLEKYPYLLSQFNSFLPSNNNPKVDSTPTNVFQEKEVLSTQQYLQAIISRFPENERQTYKEFINLISKQVFGIIDMETVVREIQRLFYGQPDLLRGFLTYLPPDIQGKVQSILDSSVVTPPPQIPSLIPSYSTIPQYTTVSPYQAYAYQTMPFSTIQTQPYLPPMSNQYTQIPYYSQVPQNPPPQPQQASKPSSHYPSESNPRQTTDVSISIVTSTFESIKKEGGSVAYSHFLRFCSLLADEIISFAEFIEMIENLYCEHHTVLTILANFFTNHHIPTDYITTAPTALSLEQVKKLPRCTPSYHLLPSDYLHRGGSQRTYLEGKLLNDNWISCAIGSEDFTSGISHRNTYAEALFRVEDDRFEADVLIETNRHCIGQLEILQKELAEKEGDAYRLIDSSLSALDKRAIRRLYSDSGVDKTVLQMLYEMPAVVIPLLLRRLREKEEEWIEEKCLNEDNWRHIQEENYCRSLDIRSYTFKSQDKKTIQSKSFLDSIASIASNYVKDYAPSLYKRVKHLGYDSLEAQLAFSMKEAYLHKAVIRILLAGCRRNLPYSDNKRFKTVLIYLICHIFNLPEEFIEECDNINGLFLQNHDMIDESIQINHTPLQTGHPSVVYCNNAIYVFYRYYQLIYSRLSEIARLCEAAYDHRNEFQISHTVKREAYMKEEKPTLTISQRFGLILNHTILFLRNEEDSNVYEDAVRDLVGAGGYILYTADKVISLCCKHIHSLFNENINNDLIASFALYEENHEKCSLDSYRSHVIRLLANYHLALYKIHFLDGNVLMWLVGNSNDLQQNEELFVTSDEFSKFARDFLSVQSPSGKSRNEQSFDELSDDEMDEVEEESDDGYEEVKKKNVHGKKRRGNRRRHQEDAEWNDF